MLNTLMPNWQTLKSLLRAYAQADGQVLFRETKPSVATQAAAPYVNAATQMVGDVVAPAWDTVQDIAATTIGAGRFLSFSLTGLVDFFGPIAEETPLESLQRMTKTLVNGTFALTTRAAKFASDGVPGNSRYEKNVAATEFGLSVLAVWGAVENLVMRPPTASFKPIPVMHEFAVAGAVRTYVPAAGLAIELPKPPPHILMMATGGTPPNGNGNGKRPTKDDLIRQFQAAGNNVSRLAKALKVSRAIIYIWFEQFGIKELLPIQGRRKIPARSETRRHVGNDELARLYVKHGYNVSAVADELGLNKIGLLARIQRALNNGPSTLKFIFEIRRGIVAFKTITADHILAVLQVHPEEWQKAVAFLGLSAKAVMARLRNAGHQSVIDGILIDTLAQYKDNQRVAAARLGMSPQNFFRQLQGAKLRQANKKPQ